ncbi:hemin-degrading factor [Skermanella stibiiresistens]|uniref:hemin-degrading factor n=1 Tax=Skermanella stibiiresistens TaxID=913326 RepID=UPI0004AD0A41|nr:ChuX/HutX family heme-like substrate-binding protein [Skermanella stibiiresistens]
MKSKTAPAPALIGMSLKALPGMPLPANDLLWDCWQVLRKDHPGIRARDAANQLEVPEAALIASGCGRISLRLRGGDWGDFLERVGAIGPVMALTRNEHAVIEKTGTYRNIQCGASMGLVLDPDIDLRLFLDHWRHLFMVREDSHGNARHSLQVFDAAGVAVHKIYLTDASDRAAFDRLVADRGTDDQTTAFVAEPPPERPAPKADELVDLAGFHTGWDALLDTHEFFGLLRRFNLGRVQALRLAGVERARPVAVSALAVVLNSAAESGLPIMVFVGNRGCIEIHTGPVHRIKTMGPWLNVLDPGFNLHLREDHIASAWVVRKPTSDGVVTSLELFDAAGETIAFVFGRRRPSEPELEGWRELAASLPDAESAP